jgi:tetratricopeptide (TPR) repeat protein
MTHSPPALLPSPIRLSLLAPALLAAAVLLGAPAHAGDGGCAPPGADPDLAIVACSALIARAGGAPADRAAAYINRGLAYRAKGDLDGAVADFTAALRVRPRHPQALNSRGLAWREKGDHARALADLTAAIVGRRDYTQAYVNRSLVHRDLRDLDQAVEDATRALAIDPAHAQALNVRGLSHRERGDRARALADLDEAVRLQPGFAQAYVNRALVRRDLGEWDAALADLDAALRLDPRHLQAWDGRVAAHLARGRLEPALADIERILALDPGHDRAGPPASGCARCWPLRPGRAAPGRSRRWPGRSRVRLGKVDAGSPSGRTARRETRVRQGLMKAPGELLVAGIVARLQLPRPIGTGARRSRLRVHPTRAVVEPSSGADNKHENMDRRARRAPARRLRHRDPGHHQPGHRLVGALGRRGSHLHRPRLPGDALHLRREPQVRVRRGVLDAGYRSQEIPVQTRVAGGGAAGFAATSSSAAS